MRPILAVVLAAASLGATASGAHAAGPVVDPQCLNAVPWVVDPDSGPIQVWGCRAVSEIPAADAQGWVEYDDPDGGFTRARLVSTAPDGAVTFSVQYNGGGSGTFPYTVTGKPDAQGTIPAGAAKIDALPAS